MDLAGSEVERRHWEVIFAVLASLGARIASLSSDEVRVLARNNGVGHLVGESIDDCAVSR